MHHFFKHGMDQIQWRLLTTDHQHVMLNNVDASYWPQCSYG